MTIDTNDILNSILESLSRIDYIHPEDIPNIDLYMDQVTTFMDTQLSSTKRYADDKILTKTMINNYAKNNLLPPPVKKKYSKDHLLLLIFIYYFKSILSIKDIETLLKPMTDAGFGQDSDKDTSSLADMYQQICTMCKGQLEPLKENISSAWETAGETFSEIPDTSKDTFQILAFICSLSFDVYVKKMMIEKLIDTFPAKILPIRNKNTRLYWPGIFIFFTSFIFPSAQTPYRIRHFHNSIDRFTRLIVCCGLRLSSLQSPDMSSALLTSLPLQISGKVRAIH